MDYGHLSAYGYDGRKEMMDVPRDFNRKWDEIFGEAWSGVADLCPEIGAYMLDHSTRKVILDRNAQKLLEVDALPDYDGMLGILDTLANQRKVFAMLTATSIYDSEDTTAGILRWNYDFSGTQAKDVLPVYDKGPFSAIVSRCKTPSVLALLEFSISDDHSTLNHGQLFGVLAATISAVPDGAILCANHKNCFWLFVPDFPGDAEELLFKAQQVVSSSGQAIGVDEKTADRYITFTAGIGADNGATEQRMGTALFALYEANLSGEGSILRYSSEQYELSKVEYEKMSRFLRLVNENLFQYHFQPIVSAKSGELVAYEMLMRTDPSIGMFPLEILDCADKAKRLYDIERATIENALSIIEQHQDVFQKRKLFVNSITAHMLSDEDWNALANRYGELMEKMVIEFTEQSELDAERIDSVRARLLSSHTKIAIDDFGTGYSNTMNLLRYSPDCVKIDRSLISGIDTKPTLRKLVSGIIEFIHENGYQALAEGVETFEELQVMIQLGSDLIQGYYVSKPKPIMLYEVSDSIRHDIETINLINSGDILRPYHPAEGEIVDLCLIRGDRYNSVYIDANNVTLKGRSDIYLDTMITIKDGLECTLTLDTVKLRSDKDAPFISLGNASDVEIVVKGQNELDGRGIHVPYSAALLIVGDDDGVLNIHVAREDSFAIGTGIKDSHGKITVDMKGKLNIKANGNDVTGIGGGKNALKAPIRLLGGEINLTLSGSSCLCIGTADGGSIVDIEHCTVNLDVNAPDGIGIGSFHGNTDIAFKNCKLHQFLSGIEITGIGSNENGTGRVEFWGTTMNGKYMGRTVNCIGTRNGNTECRIRQSEVSLYSEGGTVTGIGDMVGAGNVIMEEVRLDIELKAGSALAYGTKSGVATYRQVDEALRVNV